MGGIVGPSRSIIMSGPEVAPPPRDRPKILLISAAPGASGELAGELEVVATVAPGTAPPALEGGDLDAVVLDLQAETLPERAEVSTLREAFPDVPILVVSTSHDGRTHVDGLRDGVQSCVTPDAARSGEIARLVRDLGARRRMEETLRESEERYRTFFEDDLTADYISTPDGRVLDCNPAFVTLFGYDSRDHALRSDTRQLYPDRKVRERLLEQVREKRKLERVEVDLRRLDGTRIHVIENIIGKFDARGQLVGLQGYIFDITERVRLEEQLRHSQKMDAVGRMAGGIAHDFNNLLSVIRSYSELLIQTLSDEDPRKEDVQEIAAAAERAEGLTRQLLAFGRKQVLMETVFDANAAVHDMQRMVRRLLAENITIETELHADALPVTADRGQLEQVLVNLVVNARDAMPRGGRLRLETSRTDLRRREARKLEVVPGTYASIAVSDDGLGMDSVTRARAFEPFFTTKGARGTGLGLSTVYGIVSQSSGAVTIDSTPGAGTRVTVYLPLTTAVHSPTPTSLDAGVPTGAETLIVVEDDDSVRVMLERSLRALGYRVLSARNGIEALGVARRHTGTLHLVITDVVMPEMGGRELIEKLRLERPKIPVLFISGYPDGPTDDIEANTLPKPFTPAVLARRVRQLLD